MKKLSALLCIPFLLISCINNKAVYVDPIPVYDSLTIRSNFTNEDRIINIWTPPGYHQSTDKFPVLYMPDGGIKEDFPHVANTLEKLILEKKIPPHILVGIENTERRRDLTGPSEIEYDLKYIPNPGGADNFRAFIKKELFIEINKRYRTQNKKAIIGESLAGLFVVETFLLEHDMFDYYIAIDPSLWYNENYLVKNFATLAKTNDTQKSKLWFAGSNAEDINKYTRELNAILENLDLNLSWYYSDEPKEKHNTIFRATKEKALIWTLND